jgi:hypothetical protein
VLFAKRSNVIHQHWFAPWLVGSPLLPLDLRDEDRDVLGIVCEFRDEPTADVSREFQQGSLQALRQTRLRSPLDR